MRLNEHRYRFFLTILLICSIFLSSCVELGTIRKFAQNSAVVGEKFPSLATDVYDSCVRKYRYNFYRSVKFNPTLILAIDALSGNETLNGIETDAPPQAIQAEVQCRKFKKIIPTVTLLNSALVDYMKTMGELASDDLSSYDQKLDALGSAVSDANFFNDVQIKAGNSLAKLVSKIALGFYRQKKLKNVIEESNQDVKILTDSLQKFVGRNYVLGLQQELTQIDNYYQSNLLDDASSNRSSITNTIVSKAIWDAERQRLQDKIISADAYVKILDKVRAGHQTLYDNRNKLNTKENLQLALQYAKQIEDLVEDFQKAFK